MVGGTIGDPPKGRRTRSQGVSPSGFKSLDAPARTRKMPKKKSPLNQSTEATDEDAPALGAEPAVPEVQVFKYIAEPNDNSDDDTSPSASPQRGHSQTPSQRPESRSTSPPSKQPTTSARNATGSNKKQHTGRNLRKPGNTTTPARQQTAGSTGTRSVDRKENYGTWGPGPKRQITDADTDSEKDIGRGFRVQRHTKPLSPMTTQSTIGKRTRSRAFSTSGSENDENDAKRAKTYSPRKASLPKLMGSPKPTTVKPIQSVTGKRNYDSSSSDDDDSYDRPSPQKRQRTRDPIQTGMFTIPETSGRLNVFQQYRQDCQRKAEEKTYREIAVSASSENPDLPPTTDKSSGGPGQSTPEADSNMMLVPYKGPSGVAVEENNIRTRDAEEFARTTMRSVRLPIKKPPISKAIPDYVDGYESDQEALKTPDPQKLSEPTFFHEALKEVKKRRECANAGTKHVGPAWAQNPATPDSMKNSFNKLFPNCVFVTAGSSKGTLMLTDKKIVETMRAIAEVAVKNPSKIPSAEQVRKMLATPKSTKAKSPASYPASRATTQSTQISNDPSTPTTAAGSTPQSKNSNRSHPSPVNPSGNRSPGKTFRTPGYSDSDSDSDSSVSSLEDPSLHVENDQEASNSHSEVFSHPSTPQQLQNPTRETATPQTPATGFIAGLKFVGASIASMSPFRKVFGTSQQETDTTNNPKTEFTFQPPTPTPVMRAENSYAETPVKRPVRTYAATERINRTRRVGTPARQMQSREARRLAYADEKIHGKQGKKKRVTWAKGFTPPERNGEDEPDHVPIHMRGLIDEERIAELRLQQKRLREQREKKQQEEEERRELPHEFNHRGSFRLPSPAGDSDDENWEHWDIDDKTKSILAQYPPPKLGPGQEPDITLFVENTSFWLPPEDWRPGTPWKFAAGLVEKKKLEWAMLYCNHNKWTWQVVSRKKRQQEFEMQRQREAQLKRIREQKEIESRFREERERIRAQEQKERELSLQRKKAEDLLRDSNFRTKFPSKLAEVVAENTEEENSTENAVQQTWIADTEMEKLAGDYDEDIHKVVLAIPEDVFENYKIKFGPNDLPYSEERAAIFGEFAERA